MTARGAGRLRQPTDRGNPSAPVSDDASLPELPDDVPEHLRELIYGCVQFVYGATRIALDLTPETLPLLDHYLMTVRDPRPEIVDLVSRSAGAYFGEVVRALYPARWHAPADDPARWRVELARCFAWFNPVDLALDAMGHEGGGAFHVDATERDALASALTCSRSISGRASSSRAPRSPSTGFSSGGSPRNSALLSPPRSSSRM